MARKGRTKVIYKGTLISEQSLFFTFKEFSNLALFILTSDTQKPFLSEFTLFSLKFQKLSQKRFMCS